MPIGGGWLHELKLDGFRFQIIKHGRYVQLYGRNGSEWTKRLPGFAETFRALPCRAAVLDGELILPDDEGAPDFDGLRTAARSAEEHELVFFAFDLLHRDGADLRSLPLIARKRRLARLIARGEIRCLHMVQTFDDGLALLAAAERHGLEGIVSKRRDAPYRSGPSRDWVRVKTAVWREANRERLKAFQRAG